MENSSIFAIKWNLPIRSSIYSCDSNIAEFTDQEVADLPHRQYAMGYYCKVTDSSEPLYFGPLAGYDTEELDRKGLDQDKKNVKGFKWLSKKESIGNVLTSFRQGGKENPVGCPSQGLGRSSGNPRTRSKTRSESET